LWERAERSEGEGLGYSRTVDRLPKFKRALTHARDLRRRLTDAEARLWRELRRRRFQGFKFRRQQPIGPYIVDFCCFEAKVTIELDGGGHASEDALFYDRQRTEYLRSLGLRELRFWNGDVVNKPEDVLANILRALESKS
jgi:very-short-patch-repair endonuclease